MQILEQNNNPENSEHSGSIKATPISLVRGATGPRTERGKQKSRHNALKHGIFSSVALLKGESRAEFDSLLSGFRNDLKPEGTLEEVIVDKLAVLLWRHRRLIITEAEQPRTQIDQFKRDHDFLPSGPPLDLLLRYESNLERAFDRTLNCFALDLLDSELSVFMQRLRVQGAAGELGQA